MSEINAGLNEYNEALELLNEKLKAQGEYIEIRAIGGYAMLYNNLRSGGYTVDVDTATEEYPQTVKDMIVEVSKEKGLEEDWINNDVCSLVEVMEIIDELEWTEDESYSNIKLFVATRLTLLKLKIRAVHYGGLVPRITDKLDLLDLLSIFDVHNINELEKLDVTKDLEEQYPRCYMFLKEQSEW